jgi:hypothetical protein
MVGCVNVLLHVNGLLPMFDNGTHFTFDNHLCLNADIQIYL